MARFNPSLQTQGGSAAPVPQPDSGTFAANALSGVLEGASSLIEASRASEQEAMQTRVAEQADRLLNLEQDLINSGVGKAKIANRLRSELNNATTSGEERLLIRRQLQSFRGGSLNTDLRAAQQSEEQQRMASIENNYAIIPPEYKAAFVQTTDEGVVTEDEKIRLFSEYQKDVQEQQAAKAQQREALELAQQNQQAAVNKFGKSQYQLLNNQLSKPTALFYEQVQSINLDSPTGTVDFQNAKTQAREAASQVEMQIRTEYAELINGLTDPDTIKVAEKRRDALIDTVENFVTDIEASSLDKIKRDKEMFDALKVEHNLQYIDTIKTMDSLREIYGQAADVFVERAITEDPELRESLYSEIQGTVDFTRIQQDQNNAEANGGYTKEREYQTGYVAVRKTLPAMDGVQDPKYTDRLLKNFSWTVDYAMEDGISMEDMKAVLKDTQTSSFQFHKNQATEEQQDAVEQRVNQLRIEVFRDRNDGLATEALGKPYITFNKERGVFEYEEREQGRTDVLQEGPFSTIQTLPARRNRQRKEEVENLNRELQQVVNTVKEQQPDIDNDRLYQYLGLNR